MAVRVNGDIVIDNDRKLQNIAGASGLYDQFHPNPVTLFSSPSVTTSMANPFMRITLTGNATLNITNAALGRSSILVLDRGASGWTPSFTGVSWVGDAEPSWASHRYWNIAFVSWSGSLTSGAAVGF